MGENSNGVALQEYRASLAKIRAILRSSEDIPDAELTPELRRDNARNIEECRRIEAVILRGEACATAMGQPGIVIPGCPTDN